MLVLAKAKKMMQIARMKSCRKDDSLTLLVRVGVIHQTLYHRDIYIVCHVEFVQVNGSEMSLSS